MLSYFCKRLKIPRVKTLGYLASTLFLYMPPCEVFAILKLLVERSQANQLKHKLRWHIASNPQE
jgi:hypothetical protein